MRFTLIIVLSGAVLPAWAQRSTPIDTLQAHRWYAGGLLGVAGSAIPTSTASTPIRPAAALYGGFFLKPLKVWLSTGVSYQLRNPQDAESVSPYLTLPLFVRTGHGSNRVHVLVGGGIARAVGRRLAPSYDFEARRRDGFVLVGLESDYLHRAHRSAALSMYLHYGLGPAVGEVGYTGLQYRYVVNGGRHIGFTAAISPYWYW